MRPTCRVCERTGLGRLACGRYGWKTDAGDLVYLDLCADHARALRARTAVTVLRNYRQRTVAP